MRRRFTDLFPLLKPVAFALLLSVLAPRDFASSPTQPLNSGWTLAAAGKVAASGEALSKVDYRPMKWHKAVVPGTVLTSLVSDKVYPDPLYGENNRPNVIPDSLCRQNWWYRTTFVIASKMRGNRLWLNFDGINYRAKVWMNGHLLGSVDGAFARGRFECSSIAHYGAPNAIAVLIVPPPHPGVTHEKTVAAGTGRNGGILAEDGPTFLCSIGWDWIPTIRDRNIGIWQGVSLESTGPAQIQNPSVSTTLDKGNQVAHLAIGYAIQTESTKPIRTTVMGDVGGSTFQQTMTITAGSHQTGRVGMTLIRPKLWWPNGFGPQNLYRLHLKVYVNGALSDSSDTTFGVRRIEYAYGDSDNLNLVVNGQPVVAKGGDWGMDEAMKRISPARIDAMVRYHRDANYTIIRNWVGQSTSEAFYDACDKYGIMVWDEFFQPNPSDGPNPLDLDLYLANVREKILRFRNHPCIALWCARNEGFPPKVIDTPLKSMLAELDPSRLYQPSSTDGRGVHSGGPYFWRYPEAYYNVDAPFKTEIGSMSIPTLEAIHAMMPAKDWNSFNDDWAEHDFCKGAQGGDFYPSMLAQRYGPIRNLSDFVRKAQLANYEGYRAMYEGRLKQLFHPTTGIITWMSNPARPSFVWQLYSHDLEPNASLFGVKEACEPIHVQLNQDDDTVSVINNTDQDIDLAKIKATFYSEEGKVTTTKTFKGDAKPFAATNFGPLDHRTTKSTIQLLFLDLFDKSGKRLSANCYWLNGGPDKDDLSELDNMPWAQIKVSAHWRMVNGRLKVEATIKNSRINVALMTHLQLRDATTNTRILPVFYSNNYLNLRPGETATVQIDAPYHAGEKPKLVFDGWNLFGAENTGGRNSVQIEGNPDFSVLHMLTTGYPAVLVDCGAIPTGGQPIGYENAQYIDKYGWQFDNSFAGGRETGEPKGFKVDLSGTPGVPKSIFQTERYGPCAYYISFSTHIPCHVNLYFAEFKFGPGERQFDVSINGSVVLKNFDIAAEVGKGVAVKKTFEATANSSGVIVVRLLQGKADLPKICGISVTPE